MATPQTIERPDTTTVIDDDLSIERPWTILLFDDPVNIMNWVVRALCRIFGYDKAKAERLMLDAHENGKAAVYSGSRETAETYTAQLHAAGLQATLVQD